MGIQFSTLREGQQFHFNGYLWTKATPTKAVNRILAGIYTFLPTDFVQPA